MTDVIDWSGAFIAYCRNIPNEEICAIYGIGEARLQKRITSEKWAHKRSNLLEIYIQQAGTLVTEDQIVKSEAQLQAVLANREINFRQADKLRTSVESLLDNVRTHLEVEDEAERAALAYDIEKQGDIAIALQRIAKAMETAQMMTYRALGDLKPQEESDGKNHGDAAGQIKVLLPKAIALPRQLRLAAN